MSIKDQVENDVQAMLKRNDARLEANAERYRSEIERAHSQNKKTQQIVEMWKSVQESNAEDIKAMKDLLRQNDANI